MLCDLPRDYGRDLMTDSGLKGLLMDYCSSCRAEVYVLVGAAGRHTGKGVARQPAFAGGRRGGAAPWGAACFWPGAWAPGSWGRRIM